MLIRRLQEFIDALSLQEGRISSFDAGVLNSVKEKFALTPPHTPLSDDDLNWLNDVFATRWTNVFDTSEDYTFSIKHANQVWIALAKDLALDLKQPWLRIIIPVLFNDKDPDNFVKLSQITDPRDIYLDEDGKSWHSLFALFSRLQKNPRDLKAQRNIDTRSGRSLSPGELFRIQNKTPKDEPCFNGHASFWRYLLETVALTWSAHDRIDPQLLALLLDMIENYNIRPVDHDFDFTQEQSFNRLCQYMRCCKMDDLTRFYGVLIEFQGQKTPLIDVFIGLLLQSNDTQERLQALAAWIYHVDLSLPQKTLKSPGSTSISRATKYFDIHQLKSLLSNLPFKLRPNFECRLDQFELNLKAKTYIDTGLFHEISCLMSMPWQDIIDPLDELGMVASREYTSFWQYVIHRFAPEWQNKGKVPMIILVELLGLIDNYYRTMDQPHLVMERMNSIISFLNTLGSCTIEDLNYFYATLINKNGRSQYLLEILLECLQDTESLPSNIPLLAKWLYGMNPSLVAKAPALDGVYQTLQAGRHFTVHTLRNLLALLITKPSSSAALQRLSLQQELSVASEITQDLIESIKTLYKTRWHEIIDTAEDYTRLAGGQNTAWIRLAQSLAGAGYITPHYYRLLIPTLTHDVEFVTKDPLTMYPLTDFILSASERARNRELIYLPNCVRHFENNRTFFNPNNDESNALTSREKQRMLSAMPQYLACFQLSEQQQNNLGLSQMSVVMLKELVDKTVYADGLILGKSLSETELTQAYQGYEQFLAYIKSLPKEERQDFYQHRIRGNENHHEYTFLEVLEIILNRGECIATYGKLFIKLVVDYNPRVEFSQTIEMLADIASLRRCSERRLYRPPEHSSQTEAVRRLLTLMVSLLTHPFSYYGRGIPISIQGRVNTVTSSGWELYKIISQAIAEDGLDKANSLYCSLIQTIIEPALKKTSLTRSNDTLFWLQSIENGTLFNMVDRTSFEPALLLTVLCKMIMSDRKLGVLIEPYMDDLIEILANEKNSHVQWVRINVGFFECLKRMTELQRKSVLDALRQPTEVIPPSDVLKAIADYYTYPCSHGTGPGFFKMVGSADTLRVHGSSKQENLPESCHSVSELLTALRSRRNPEPSRFGLKRMSEQETPVMLSVSTSAR